MKITRAQKDAVISLLMEKFDEKQKLANEAYLKNNKSKIQSEIKAFKQDQDKLESLLISAKEIVMKWMDTKDRFTFGAMRINYGWDWKENTDPVTKYSEDDLIEHVVYPTINTPNYAKVERQLELDTLSKDFNVDEFIKKYLDN